MRTMLFSILEDYNKFIINPPTISFQDKFYQRRIFPQPLPLFRAPRGRLDARVQQVGRVYLLHNLTI